MLKKTSQKKNRRIFEREICMPHLKNCPLEKKINSVLLKAKIINLFKRKILMGDCVSKWEKFGDFVMFWGILGGTENITQMVNK